MRTDSTSAPSDNRWRRLLGQASVGRSELGLDERVEPERARRAPPAGPRAGSGHPLPTGRRPPTGHRRSGAIDSSARHARTATRRGRPTRARTGRAAGRAVRGRRRPAGGPRRRPLGRRSRGALSHGAAAVLADHPVGDPTRVRPRPRRYASPAIRRPPAGWTSSSTRRPSIVVRAKCPSCWTSRPGSASTSRSLAVACQTVSRPSPVSR